MHRLSKFSYPLQCLVSSTEVVVFEPASPSCKILHICWVWQLKRCPTPCSIHKSAVLTLDAFGPFFISADYKFFNPNLLGLRRFIALKGLSNYNCKSDLGTALLSSSYLLVSKRSIYGNSSWAQITQEATKPFTIFKSMVTGECRSSYSLALLLYWLI